MEKAPTSIPENLIWGENVELRLVIPTADLIARLPNMNSGTIRYVVLDAEQTNPDILRFLLTTTYGRMKIWLIGSIAPSSEGEASISVKTGVDKKAVIVMDACSVIGGIVLIVSSGSVMITLAGCILGFGLIRSLLWFNAQSGSDMLVNRLKNLHNNILKHSEETMPADKS